jgi:L-threonylcarbamoyladenylate synthase
MLLQVADEISPLERSLMQAYWPGPLTLLLPKTAAVPALVTAGRAKVGVRMPAHPVARALIQLAGVPLAAPSANSFGRISPTSAQHVLEDLDGRIDAILDGGITSLGLESTVLDAGITPPTLYRHGMISLEDLQSKLPSLVVYEESAVSRSVAPDALPSPGVGLRHYAPRAKLVLIEGEYLPESLGNAIAAASGTALGVLLPDDFRIPLPPGVRVVHWGRWDHPEELAQRLFAGLRTLDSFHVERILCPLPASAGIGAALRDRLRKASKTSEQERL